jgi:GcrA cell cycle regulator
MAVVWTPSKVERLREMAAKGLSAGQIARLLREGMTRNAVVGKCARLGIRLGGNQGPSQKRTETHHEQCAAASPPRRFSWQDARP